MKRNFEVIQNNKKGTEIILLPNFKGRSSLLTLATSRNCLVSYFTNYSLTLTIRLVKKLTRHYGLSKVIFEGAFLSLLIGPFTRFFLQFLWHVEYFIDVMRKRR